MSKMNNNSRKNSKNTKKSAKKAVRSKKSSPKNFKIENLEPRLMMDAAGFDVDKLEQGAYTSQFDSVVETIGSELVTKISSFNDYNVSKIGISNKFISPVQLLCDLPEDLKNDITNNVNAILTGAINLAKTQIENSTTKITLSEFVDSYVKGYLDSDDGKTYKDNFSFSAEDSQLFIDLKLSNNTSISNIDLELDSLGKLEANGARDLSSSAEIQIAIDLDKNNNGSFLEDDNDFNVVSTTIKKLESSIQDLNLKSKFANISVVEQTLEDETDADLIMSYDGSKVTTDVNLEFKLDDSYENLPFEFEDSAYLKITKENGKFVANIPKIQIRDDYSLASTLSMFVSGVSCVNDLKLKMNGQEDLSIAGAAPFFNDILAKSSVALSGAVQRKSGSEFVLNVRALQDYLSVVVGNNWRKVFAVKSLDGKKVADKDVVLKNGENKISLTISPLVESLSNLSLYSQTLNDLEAKLSFDVEMTFSVDSASGIVSFGVPSGNLLNLNVSGIELSKDEGFPVVAKDGELNISLDGQSHVENLDLNENFTMDSVLKGFSASDLPIFEKLRIPVESNELTIPEVASKLDVLWNYFPLAISDNLTETLDVAGLQTSLNAALTEKYTGLSSVIDSIDVVGDKTALDFSENEENLAVTVNLKSGCLDKLDLDLFDLKNVEMKTSFVVNVVLTKEKGVVQFKKASLKNLGMTVDEQSVTSVLINGFDAALTDGKFHLNVSIVNNDGRLNVKDCSSKLTYSEIKLKSGSSTLKECAAGTFSYSYIENNWSLPGDVTEAMSRFNADTFSISSLVQNAGTLPFLDESALDIVPSIDELRKGLAFAIVDNLEVSAGANPYSISAKTLTDYIEKNVANDLKNQFTSAKIEFVNSNVLPFELLDNSDNSSVVDIKKGVNSIKITFKPTQTTLNKLRVYGIELSNASVDSEIIVSFNLNVGDNDEKNIDSYSLNDFTFTVKNTSTQSANSPVSIDSNGLVISYNSNGWNDSGISFNAPQLSFVDVEKDISNVEFLSKGLFDGKGASTVIEQISQVWGDLFSALESTVKYGDDTSKDFYTLDTGELKTSLKHFIDLNKTQLSWLSNIKIVSGEVNLLNEVSNGYEIWSSNSESGDVKLIGDTYTIVFDLNKTKLNELEMHSQTFKNIDANTLIALKITLSTGQNCLSCSPAISSVLFDVASKEMNKSTTFELNGNVQALWNGKEWNSEYPDLILSGVSIDNALSAFENVKINELDKSKLSINNDVYDFGKIAEKTGECWNCMIEALYGKLAVTKKQISDTNELNTIVSDYEKLLTEKLGSANNSIFDTVKLENSGNKYTIKFTSNSVTVSNFGIGRIDVGSLSGSIELSLNVEASINGDDVSLKNALIDKCVLTLSKQITNHVPVVKDKYNASLTNGEFELKTNISIDVSQQDPSLTLDTSCKISYSGLDLKASNGNSIKTFANDELVYNSEKWQLPSDVKNYITIYDEGSLKKQVNLPDNYELPYVGKTLKINGDDNYTVSEIVDKVDSVRTTVMFALQEALSENANKYDLDLSKVAGALADVNADGFLDELKLTIPGESTETDLLNISSTSGTKTFVGDLEIKFVPKINDITLTLGGNSVTTSVNADISINVTIDKTDNSLKSSLKTFSFDLPGITSANTDELAYKVGDGSLNVSVKNGVFQPNVKLDELVDLIYFPMDGYLDILDNVDIPLLNNVGFSLGSSENFNIKGIVENFDSYSRFAQSCIDDAIDDDYKIKLETVQSFLAKYVNGIIPLDGVSLCDKILTGQPDNNNYNSGTNFYNLLDSTTNVSNKALVLNDGRNEIVFKVSTKSLKYEENINLGLLNLNDFNVGVDVYLKLVVYVSKQDSCIVLDDCCLDKIDLNLSVGVEKINLGLFDIKLPDGKFSFKVGINPNVDLDNLDKLITDKSISLEYGKVYIAGVDVPLISGNSKEYLSYNIDSGEWTLPDTIRKFASFSGDNLVTKIHTVLNTTQSALRSLVESKTKLDFLDGSIEKVVNVVDKVEKVVYGDGQSKNSNGDLYGLCKEDKGQYHANFSDVTGFVDRFNDSWCYFVLDKNPQDYYNNNPNSRVCSATYFYKKGGDELPYAENATKMDDGISSVELSFTLGFELGHEFGLNFAKSLGNQLANISTCGSIHVNADASISFVLKIDFESQKNLDDHSMLSDIGLFDHELYDENAKENKKIDVTINEHYTTYDAGSTRSFDEDLYIKVLKQDKSEWTTFTVNKTINLGESKKLGGSGDWVTPASSSGVEINYISSTRQIYVTANEKFEIENAATTGSSLVDVKKKSSGGDAFAELKLTGSNLQTMLKVKPDPDNGTEWTINFIEDNDNLYEDNGSLKSDLKACKKILIEKNVIENLVNNGIILANDWKKRINEYLGLQVDDSGSVTLADGTTVCLSDCVSEGRSIMNTFGLYVVDVNSDGIVFGCDSRLIASDGDIRYLLCQTKSDTSNVVDYITYMRISGEINPSMNTTGMKGALVYKVDKNGKIDGANEVQNIYYVELEVYNKDVDKTAQITKLNNSLNADLKSYFEFVEKDIDDSEWTVSLERKKTNPDEFDYIVKYTDRILKMNVGSAEVLVDVEKCLTVENLAETIYKTIKSYKNLSTSITSVGVVDGQIVFTAENDPSVKVYQEKNNERNLSSNSHDFWIENSNEVDFQTCLDECLPSGTVDNKKKETLEKVEISDLLNSVNKYLENYKINLVKDHFEITHNNPDKNKDGFVLHSSGTSRVLDWLGFTPGQESRLINGEMKIIGSSVVAFDWAKAISLKDIVLKAGLSLKMGSDVVVKKASDLKGDCVSLSIDEKDKNDYNVDGFIALDIKGTKYYYRILKVEKNDDGNGIAVKSIVVSLNPINGENSLQDALKLSTWKDAKYVASASASVGFLGVDVIAAGDTKVNAVFNLTTPGVGEDADIFGFKINQPSILLDNKGYSNEFNLEAYADVFDCHTKIASGKIKAKTEDPDDSSNKKISLDTEFDLNSNGFKEILNQFKNFSIEKLFAVLESLLQRLDDITRNSDVKIPVINKSVRDLVNVANDLRDIIAKLRAEKVTTIQKFGDLLNTYLEEFHLTSHTPNEKLFKLDTVYEDTSDGKKFKGLQFTFNIQKDFDTRHRFSFGSGTSGVHGNIDLNVTGDFWFTLSALLDISNLNLELNDSLKFGADIGIAGDKLRFDLGINAGAGKENLLSNLISVGSDKNDAFIYGKVGFEGTYGDKGAKLSEFKKDSFNYSLPVAIFGKLPVYACNMSLGDVYIGQFVKDKIAFSECETYDKAKESVESIMSAYLNKQNSGEKLYILSSSEGSDNFNFDLKTGTETEEELKELDKSFVVDFTKAYEKISELADFANMDWFSKIKLAVAGLNNLFEMLESSMNSNMGSKLKSVPVLGSALSSGVDFLSVLRDNVLDPFSKFVYESTGLTAEMVATKLNSLFGNSLLDVSYDPDDNYYFDWNEGDAKANWNQAIAKSGTHKGTWYRTGKDSAEWFFNLGGTYDYGKSINFDLGFPGLGLSSDAGLELSLSWALEFGFGISREKGFYFIFGEGNEIDVTAVASLDGRIVGSLAGLGLALDVDGDKTKVKLDFGVDLNKPEVIKYDAKSGLSNTLKAEGTPVEETKLNEAIEKAKTNKELNEKKNFGIVTLSNAFAVPKFEFSADVMINADITVGITKDLDRNTPKFPNITGKFEFHWDYTKENGSTIHKLGFSDLKLDMGSFISGVLGPIVSKIQKVIEPLEPLIDFLTTPFPVLKDLGIKMTPLDLAKKYSKGKFDDSMVYAIKDLIAVSKTISTINGSGLTIDLGNFILVDESDHSDTGKSAMSFLEGKSSSNSIEVEKHSDTLKKGDGKLAEEADKKLKDKGLHMEGSGEWEFVWSNPSQIFKLLLGEDIDLVKYTMPKLCFDFDWSTFVRIWGPLGARIGVSFSASIQLGFGYDTLGIRQWVKSGYKDFGRLLNGFYVADWDKSGTDINELSFYGGLTASAELNAGISAGVGGGVGIDVGFNLYDPNKDGKVRLSEMTQIIKRDGLFGMFDVNGKITAKLYAYVDLLFYTKKWNITGDITLFEFNYEHKTAPVMASRNDNGDIVGHVGPNAGNRISTNDVNPTLTDGDESITLVVTGKTVSWNNGDDSETAGDDGRLIIDGGAGVDKITVEGNAKLDVEIIGGDGDDIIDLSGLTVEEGYAVIIKGGSGNDIIYGAKGLNIIFGDTGVARIDDERENENDPSTVNIINRKFVIDANVEADGAGDDLIIGNSENGKDPVKTRNFIVGGAGLDKIYGGIGDDIIFGDGGKVEFEIINDANNVEKVENDDKAKTADYKERATFDEHKFIASAEVKSIAVQISRTDISLDGGDDVILGGAGIDYIYGGAGNDRIDGGAGEDHIYGERGHDILLGGSDDDEIRGGAGHDIIFGDKIEADVDIDKLFDKKFFSDEFKDAQFNNKKLFSGNKIETKFFDIGEKDKITPDSGLAGVDYIYGEEGDDLIFGDSGNETDNDQGDTIEGGIGNDIIDGNGGNDTIEGGIDNDIIYGGSGDDTIDGGAGNDSLYGDEGIRGKKGNRKFVGEQITFGENKGLLGEVYKDIQSSADGGNDRILTGPGMDFVDGQGGSDQFFVNLMGESETNYANITDTGTGDFDTDTLTIEGTEYNDNLLMRMNKEKTTINNVQVEGTLGFVALLPDTNLGQNEVGNTNIERVNFTSSIDVVNLNANGGDDKITVDGTAKKTNIDGGAGDDSFQVGQFFNSERISSGKQGIVKDDEFNTVQVVGDDKFLSDGVTKDSTLNIEGGIGNDSFVSLHNVGNLSMAGGRGDDTFSVYNYCKKEKNPNWTTGSQEPEYFEVPVDSGAMSVDGGAGNDLLNVAGTTGDDTVIVKKEGILSSSVGIKIAGVETTNFDAGAGDDMFFVLANNKNDTTIINGGHGNDTVSVGGGPDVKQTLRSANTDGQTNHLKYEIITTENQGLSPDQANKVDGNVSASVLLDEEYTVIDTSNEPTVFYSLEESFIKLENVKVTEGGIAKFYIGYSGYLDSGTIQVTLTVPMLSSAALQRGDRGVLIRKDGTSEFKNEVTFELNSSCPVVAIEVKALSDNLLEETLVSSINVQSVWSVGNTKLTRSVNVISVTVEDDSSASNDEYKNLLTRTEEFRIQEAKVNLGEFGKSFDSVNGSLYVYVQNTEIVLGKNDYDISNGVLTIKNYNETKYKNKVLVVNYRSNKMQLDGSKIRLVYDNLALKKDVDNKEVYFNELTSVKYENKEVFSKEKAGVNDEIYYALYGDSLVFFHKANNRLATLHGKVEVTANARITDVPEDTVTKKENKLNSDLFEIESISNDRVFAEKGSDNEVETNFNTTKVKIKYKGDPTDFANDKSIFIKVYAEDVVSEKDGSPDKQLYVYQDDQDDKKNGYKNCEILEFNKDTLEHLITVYAKHDNVKEEYGYTTIPANFNNQVISDIEGKVHAFGKGASMDSDFDNPEVLRYNHKFKDNGKVVNASKYNEKNTYDVNKMCNVSSIDLDRIEEVSTIYFVYDATKASQLQEGGTVKIVKGNLETDWLYVKSISKDKKSFTVKGLVEGFGINNLSNVYVLFSDPKNYLFTPEEDNTDRIFVNNQKSTADALTKLEEVFGDDSLEVHDSVRFTNKDLTIEKEEDRWQGEIVANNFEYGEYNLGSGVDTVDISKTHYRNDGFQTFTVVNTGDGADLITVSSYKAETEDKTKKADGQLVINAEKGDDHIYAPDPEADLDADAINKDGMVVFGGDGKDVINVGRGVIAFGDKGNIQYKNAKDETVTNLGYEEVEENNVKTGKLIRTKISKEKGVLQKQTDGIVRGATSIKSVMDEEGAHDEIIAGGTKSIVIGGADKDAISVGGDDNVVLGDNGEIAYATTESLTAKWDDPEKPTVKLKHVMTTKDNIGDEDTITISGNSNVAMGGAGQDKITIGSKDEKDPDATEQSVSEENSTGNANVVLGDGGVYEFDKQSNTVTVHTSREEKNGKVTIYGDKDEIKIYGGHNTVMGGAAGDDIDIYGADNIVLGDGGIAVRDDKKDVAESIKSVQTTDDSEGGVDNINVWGGDNTVMGGADGDNINIGGNLEKEGEEEKSVVLSNNNVVLGDGGKYERQSADSKTIETTHDSIGGVDTINIYGGNNTVMGGAVGDTINIGIAGQPNSGANNIILGDGGKYVENSTEKTVQTTSDAIGGVDTIHVYGGSNVAMGGADGDKIYIGEAKGTVNQNGEVSVGYDSDNNVVLGDGGKYDLQKNESLDIRTTSDKVGGKDTIEIHGGKNAVMGGFRDDKIDIFGADNVVLGDGGIANYDKHPEVVKEDTSVNAGLIKIETTADEIEVVKEGDDPVRLNDNITIHGDINIVMGGVDDDNIVIDGADNVVVGDAGVYTVRADCLTVETKNEPFGGQDYIQTGDGQNTILGGTDADTILTGTGNDIIVGDGGLVIMDKPDGKNKGHNPLIVTNSGKNVDEERAAEEYEREQANKNEEVVQMDGDSTGTPDDSGDGSVDQTDTVKPPVRSAGGDFIYAGDGDNVIFGGLGKDHIESGKGEDVVFGDNGYATFRGNADLANNLQNTFTDLEGVFEFTNAPEVRTDSTLSFNFQGAAQQGINPDEKAGVSEFEALQWNNITGNLAGTYGNDDKEMVRFNDGTRASSVSVTYAGREAHRTTSTDNSINLQNYNHWLWGNSANNRLMTSGIMTTAPNNMMQNVMEVTIDGLKQYYDSYQVIVYLDLPDANSWAEQSIREVTLTVGDFKQSIFVNDYQGANFNGGFKKSTYQSAEEIIDIINANKTKPANERVDTYGNYVVFEVSADVAHDIDRAIITIQDGYTKDQMNGKDIPGIAGLQIKGVHHKQDIAASTDVAFGGNDSILTRGGDDIVVGGTGGDNIVTHGGDNVIDEDGKIVPRVTETATASSATAQDESGDGAAQVQESDEAKRKREIAEHVAAHTTFGDERLGIYDNDVVFGDNAKMLFTERDGNPETASTLTTAESVTIAKGEISHSEKDSDGNELKDEFKYKDTIITGDGNDVVVGGIGADHIESGATAAANEMMDGINVLSINFTREHSNASDSIAAGESAGVVVDNAWHNFYRNDRGVIVSDTAYSQSQSNMNAYNEAMNRLCNSPDSSNPYARAEGVEVHMYGKMNGQRQGPSSFTIENHDEIDGDTSNTKLYNTYIASQQSEEIVLKLLNLDTFVGNSGNTIDTTSYDLYVYIGGDNNDTDTFNYLYEIKLTDAQGNTYRRYLNDWTGHKFDGDYKEAYCTNKQKALEALTDFTTPRVEIIGNYVVFHGVTGNMADIRIRNVFSLNGQSPKNLPMITAVQIVSGDGRYKESENGSLEFNDKHYELADIAVGGDHDKDLVYGDEAKLWFDLDVPFASDENIADYKNRVIEAKSIAVDDDVVKAVSTEDDIETGKDRDVVVAGEGADDIRTGAGDDVVLGGSANLIVEHNNPVGVFTPNTEIVLDQHTINTNLHQNYLDNDNANVGQFQNLLNQNRIAGIDTSVPNTNDRLDQIDAGEGRNITSQASYSTEKLVVEPPPPAPPAPDPINQGSGEGQGSGVTTGDVVLTSSPQIVSLTAGETIKLVCTDYPKGNQWWTPNVVIYGNNAGNGVIPEIDWAWDGETRVHTNVTNNVRVDIPDHPNGANGTYEIYLTAKTSGMIFLYVDQG